MSVAYHTNVPFSAIDDRAKRLKEQDIKVISAMMKWPRATNPFHKNLFVRVNLKSHLSYTPKNATVRHFHRHLDANDADKILKTLQNRLKRWFRNIDVARDAFVFGGLHHDNIHHLHIHMIVGCPDNLRLTDLKHRLIEHFSNNCYVRKAHSLGHSLTKKTNEPISWIDTQEMEYEVGSYRYSVKNGTDDALLGAIVASAS